MKRFWSILLAGLLCIGMLAGCAPAEQQAQASGPAPEATVEQTGRPSVPESAVVSPSPSAALPPPAEESGPAAGGTGIGASSAKGKNTGTSAVKEPESGTPDGTDGAAASTPEQAGTPEFAPQQPETITCTIAIDCKAALDVEPDLANAVSSGGTILGGKTVTLDPGATVYDALRATGVTFSGKSYISSINSIGEGDCGPQSGWMYSVNGDYPGVGCTKYTLSDGDSIRWRYTCNMGADIGA